MTPAEMWRDIAEASGLRDLACEIHDHDLLDPEGPPNAPLVVTFSQLYRREGCKGWAVEPVLRRMRTIPGFEGLRVPDEVTEKVCDKALGTEDRSGAHLTSLRRGTYSSDHGTPAWIIGIVLEAFPAIDLDLASSVKHNAIVGARAWYSEDNLCPKEPEVLPGDVVWSNPPGPGWSVKAFWNTWLGCLSRGAQGAFLFFNTDTMRGVKAAPGLETILLKRRVQFVGAKHGASFPSAMVFSGEAPRGHGHVMRWL